MTNNKHISDLFIRENRGYTDIEFPVDGNLYTAKEIGDSNVYLDSVVYLDSTNNKVYPFSNNKVDKLALGIVTYITNDLSVIITTGNLELPQYSFILGKNVFLSPTGAITQNPPTSGYLHVLGTAIGQHTILLKDYRRIKRFPFD